MDLMDKLASLAQRYEELNTLMAQPEVLDDIPLLQRYGREHAELEDVVNKYHEIVDNDKQINEAKEMYESDDLEMRDLAFEEIERLKARKEHLLEEVKLSLLPKDTMDDKNAIVTIQGGAGGDEAAFLQANSSACIRAMPKGDAGKLKSWISMRRAREVSKISPSSSRGRERINV